MGVVYKLNPKIMDFILEKKKKEPILSCRKLSTLVLDKFQIKLSKSRINSLIKAQNLSMPVGRRRKVKRGVVEIEGMGVILLKAADCLAGTSYQINEAIANRLKLPGRELLAKTECLIYRPLFELSPITLLNPDFGLWQLINQRFSREEISSYLTALQEVRTIPLDILRIISTGFQEVRCVRVSLSDKTSFYLDAQLHTVWSTFNIPNDFSTTHYNIKSYIDKYFKENQTFVLFMAPGYETPTKEFFSFLASLDKPEKKRILQLVLYGNNLEELERVPLLEAKKRNFVFGLWPWQFSANRKVKTMGEFKPFYFSFLREDFYLGEIEVELLQPNVNERVTLKGCALKTRLDGKIKLVILSNLTQEQAKPEDLANIYLSHWPNLEEGFQDYSRKIELFTYTATSQRFFSTENLNLKPPALPDINQLFADYLKVLDLYVRWHFLPSGYEDKDFSTIKERFYGLKAHLKRQKDTLLVTFIPPKGYPFLKDLEYACRRINEREIVFSDARRLRLNL